MKSFFTNKQDFNYKQDGSVLHITPKDLSMPKYWDLSKYGHSEKSLNIVGMFKSLPLDITEIHIDTYDIPIEFLIMFSEDNDRTLKIVNKSNVQHIFCIQNQMLENCKFDMLGKWAIRLRFGYSNLHNITGEFNEIHILQIEK